MSHLFSSFVYAVHSKTKILNLLAITSSHQLASLKFKQTGEVAQVAEHA